MSKDKIRQVVGVIILVTGFSIGAALLLGIANHRYKFGRTPVQKIESIKIQKP